MPFAVVYDPASPLTGAAKAAVQAAPRLSVSGGTDDQERYLAMGRSKANELLIVTTQTCDIAAAPDVEPLVFAMRAFMARDARVLAEARHSVRRFLLDPIRGLVVDAAAPIVTIEKPVLLSLVPAPGTPNIDTERLFADWLARRSARPAFPDEFNSDVKDRIVASLLGQISDVNFVFNELLGLRVVAPVTEHPPYALNLIAILPPDAEPNSARANELALRVLGLFESLREVYVGTSVSSYQYAAKRLDELSARDYVTSHGLYLD